MRAAVLERLDEPLVLADRPVPVPTETEVLVKVAACGVCGHDQAERLGLTRIDLPAVLGHEVAGTVESVGSKVRGFAVGDRVAAKQFATCGTCPACRSGRELECDRRTFNYGGYAEYVALGDTALLRVPDEVPLPAAAVVACALGTSLQALQGVAGVRPGEHVVVTGASGGLGLHGLLVARALGARTVAITSSPSKAGGLASTYADEVVLAGEDGFAEQVLDATSGRGADVVLDSVGHPSLFGPCFRALARRGRYVFTGQVARERVAFYPAFVFGKEAVITGSQSTSTATFVEAMRLVQGGRIEPVVAEFPLEQAAVASAALDRRDLLGRAVLVP